jgi:hypothetical protein
MTLSEHRQLGHSLGEYSLGHGEGNKNNCGNCAQIGYLSVDLEGIVAKRADSPYEWNSRDPAWIKIKNPTYSQKKGRGDLFKRAG